MATPPKPRGPGLLGLALLALVAFRGVTLDLPRVVPLPPAVDTTQGFIFAARLGDAAILLHWR